MCVFHLAPLQAQCTTRHCIDDDEKDNNDNVLMAMVGHLVDTLDQLRHDHGRSTEQLEQ